MRDDELIDRFASGQCQDAFAQIVHRHMDMVYACARRQVRDPQLAEDVMQAVFIIFARKAGHLRNRVSLAGWLVKTTHLAGRDALKMESRRRRHETAAAALALARMEQNMTPQSQDLWPELDSALARLTEADRTAVTLRYLEGNTTAETASMLGVSEPTAAKRISRALDRLRTILVHKKALPPAASLALILDQIPRVPAPAALAHAITAAGVATPAGLAIANGVIHMMTWKKIIAAMWLIAAIAGTTGVGVGTVKLLADQTNPPAPQLAQDPAALAAPIQPRDLVARLANGVSVQVVGVNEYPPDGGQWWAANGNPAPAPYTRMTVTIQPLAGYVRRSIAIKTNSSVKGVSDPATVQWMMKDTRGAASSNLVGARDASIDAEVQLLPDIPAGAVFRAEVAAGPWETICTTPGTGQFSMGTGRMSLLFSETFTVGGETHIIVGRLNDSKPEKPLDGQLLAIDRAGHETLARQGNGVSTAAGVIAEFIVPIPASSIKQWKLQTRPFNQWIEIRNISLHRGRPTTVKILTSDNPDGAAH